MTRHTIRKHIFSMLFRVEFHDSDEIPAQDELYMDSIEKITDEEREYMESKTEKIIARLAEIDNRLEETSEGWKVSRMGKVELTILWLAVYEILYDEEIPTNVAINEAVELAKVYGGDTSPAFVNGVLAKLI